MGLRNSTGLFVFHPPHVFVFFSISQRLMRQEPARWVSCNVGFGDVNINLCYSFTCSSTQVFGTASIVVTCRHYSQLASFSLQFSGASLGQLCSSPVDKFISKCSNFYRSIHKPRPSPPVVGLLYCLCTPQSYVYPSLDVFLPHWCCVPHYSTARFAEIPR